MTNPYDRQRLLEQARHLPAWDVLVIGGGATGAGTALDAAARGLRVLLVEQSDFGQATSSRSTKLIHGGLRYLQQGNVGLVRSALHERGILRQLAPHVVHEVPMVVPTYRLGAQLYYSLGLAVYDALAGRYRLHRSERLSRSETMRRLPTLRRAGLRAGVLFYDGGFDDARLLINMVQTAVDQGAVCLNYVAACGLIKAGGKVCGAQLRDQESQGTFEVQARVVINATGPFVDRIREMDEPGVEEMIAPSQGVHLVLDRSFLPGETALLVPRTRDGRVMFAIPWNDRIVVGTTDTPLNRVELDPRPQPREIDFLLTTLAEYLEHPPTRDDVLSAVAGIRPLVRSERVSRTASLARDHCITAAPSGLLTIAGGKWTTYRKMAEDVVDRAVAWHDLRAAPCATATLPIHGHPGEGVEPGVLAVYGSEARQVEELGGEWTADERLLHPRLPYQAGQVVWAVRHEMARTVDDVLARRTRALWLDAKAAIEAAPRVAQLMAAELGRDDAWQQDQVAAFRAVAQGYLVVGG